MATKLSWFVTENGRKLSFFATGFLGFGLFSAKFLPNTYFLDKYQNVVQMYKMGLGVPVDSKVNERFQEVLEDMQIPNNEKKLFKLFTVVGFDIFHAGTTLSNTGAIVGIPKNYSYVSNSDVEKGEILVNKRLVPWQSDAGKTLENSIVISQEAQKYAMACQISMCRSLHVHLCAAYPMLATVFAYGITSHLNRKLNLYTRKIAVRGCLYSIVGLFSVGLWALANDFTTVMYEKKADKEACNLGPQYVSGGLELYRKITSRNVALRELMGDQGKKFFTAMGNDEVLIRQKHLPITARKDYLEMRFKQLNPS